MSTVFTTESQRIKLWKVQQVILVLKEDWHTRQSTFTFVRQQPNFSAYFCQYFRSVRLCLLNITNPAELYPCPAHHNLARTLTHRVCFRASVLQVNSILSLSVQFSSVLWDWYKPRGLFMSQSYNFFSPVALQLFGRLTYLIKSDQSSYEYFKSWIKFTCSRRFLNWLTFLAFWTCAGNLFQ